MQRSHLIGLLLVVAVFAVFGRICAHEFVVWDDPETLYQNPAVSPPAAANYLRYWREPHMWLWVPVTYTAWESLAFIAQTEQADENGGRLNPWIYHTASVAVHLASVLVVFAILRLLTGKDWAAAGGALLFGLHPVQVEPVAWASGLKDLLCGLFTLTAVWQYLLYARPKAGEPGRQQGRRALHYALGMAAMSLGMLSKPTAVVAPLLAAILDYWLLRRPARQVVRSLLPWFLLAVPCVIWSRIVQSVSPASLLPLWTRPLVAGFALCFYLFKLVFPADLALDYGYAPAVVMRMLWVYAAWLVPAALAGLLWRWRRSAPAAAAGLLFLAGVLPVLGFAPFLFQRYSTVADHYLYLAMLGPALGAAWLLRESRGRATGPICAACLLLLGARAALQAGHWQDTAALLGHAVKVNPNSFAARHNLGMFLADHGQPAEAAEHLDIEAWLLDALPYEMTWDAPEGQHRRHGAAGQLLMRVGQPARAMRHFQQQLNLRPDDRQAAGDLQAAREKLRQLAAGGNGSTTAAPAPAHTPARPAPNGNE